MDLAINGRFLSQRITGVQRYGLEIVRAIDELLTLEPQRYAFSSVRLLVPPHIHDAPTLRAIETVTVGRSKGHLWEQFELPGAAAGALLLNLCQTGPVMPRHQMVVMHDASVYGVPFAFSWAFRSWYKVLMPLLGMRAERILTVSEFSRNELVKYCRIDPRKLRVVGEGHEHILGVATDPSVLERYRLPKKKYVLAVSSMNPNKNFAAVIAAVDRLAGTDCRVVIAGGADPKVFNQGGALPESVTYVGYVSDAELRALYEDAAAFIYPSFYEGFGLPPLEAMALGCPVIVSDRASLPEVCGGAALYCDPDRPEQIADAIKRVLLEPGLREKLQVAGVERARLHRWRESARSVLDEALVVGLERKREQFATEARG